MTFDKVLMATKIPLARWCGDHSPFRTTPEAPRPSSSKKVIVFMSKEYSPVSDFSYLSASSSELMEDEEEKERDEVEEDKEDEEEDLVEGGRAELFLFALKGWLPILRGTSPSSLLHTHSLCLSLSSLSLCVCFYLFSSIRLIFPSFREH